MNMSQLDTWQNVFIFMMVAGIYIRMAILNNRISDNPAVDVRYFKEWARSDTEGATTTLVLSNELLYPLLKKYFTYDFLI